MKVTLERDTKQEKLKKGFFSSEMVTKYLVKLTVDFSDAEKTIIKQNNLKDNYIMQWEFYNNFEKQNQTYQLKIDYLLKTRPFIREFDNAGKANAYEQELKESALPGLKEHLTANVPVANKKEQLEF